MQTNRKNSQFIQGQRPVRSIPRPRAGATLLLVDSTSTTFKGACDDEQHDHPECLRVPIVRWRCLHLRLPGGAEGHPIGMPLRRGVRLRARLPVPALVRCAAAGSC
jgi:hypothetical protein